MRLIDKNKDMDQQSDEYYKLLFKNFNIPKENHKSVRKSHNSIREDNTYLFVHKDNIDKYLKTPYVQKDCNLVTDKYEKLQCMSYNFREKVKKFSKGNSVKYAYNHEILNDYIRSDKIPKCNYMREQYDKSDRDGNLYSNKINVKLCHEQALNQYLKDNNENLDDYKVSKPLVTVNKQNNSPSLELIDKMNETADLDNFLKKPYEQLNCDSYSNKIDKTLCIHYNISQNIKKTCNGNKQCYLNKKKNIDKFITYFMDSNNNKIPEVIKEGSKIPECKKFYDSLDTKNKGWSNDQNNNLNRAYCAKALYNNLKKNKKTEFKNCGDLIKNIKSMNASHSNYLNDIHEKSKIYKKLNC